MTEFEDRMLTIAEAQLAALRRANGYLSVLTGITVVLLALAVVGGVLGVVLALHN